jgi:hypothetical protein
MLTLTDCIEYLGLSKEEIDAIAEHEHCPPIIAAEHASYLIEDHKGERKIRRMIIDDIEAAQARGDQGHADELVMVLKHFVATHPDMDVKESDAR